MGAGQRHNSDPDPKADGRTQVAVAPITHSPPHDPNIAIEIPLRVKEHLGLDSERSWVILEEVNIFTWPGFDLSPIKKGDSRVDYGLSPSGSSNRRRNAAFSRINPGSLPIQPRFYPKCGRFSSLPVNGLYVRDFAANYPRADSRRRPIPTRQ